MNTFRPKTIIFTLLAIVTIHLVGTAQDSRLDAYDYSDVTGNLRREVYAASVAIRWTLIACTAGIIGTLLYVHRSK